MTNLISTLRDLGLHDPRVRQAIKTTIAACLSFLIARSLHLEQAFWAAVVAIFVTQTNIGASLGQALDWVWGSLLGVLAGGAVAVAAGDVLSFQMTGLVVTVLVLAFFAATSGPMRIACVNAAIVILAHPPHESPVISAGDRMIEVMIGTLIAIAVMLIILPVRAAPSLAAHVSKTLPLYFDLLAKVLTAAVTGRSDADMLEEANAKIRAAVSKNEALRKEALTEVAGYLASTPDPEPLLTTLRRLWHTELMLTQATRTPLPADAIGESSGHLEDLRDQVVAFRDKLRSGHLDATQFSEDLAALDATVTKSSSAIQNTLQFEHRAKLSTDDAIQLYAFDFGLIQLHHSVEDLANRIVFLDHLRGKTPPKVWTS